MFSCLCALSPWISWMSLRVGFNSTCLRRFLLVWVHDFQPVIVLQSLTTLFIPNSANSWWTVMSQVKCKTKHLLQMILQTKSDQCGNLASSASSSLSKSMSIVWSSALITYPFLGLPVLHGFAVYSYTSRCRRWKSLSVLSSVMPLPINSVILIGLHPIIDCILSSLLISSFRIWPIVVHLSTDSGNFKT